ncbi:hypothetical protein QR680_017794 [Steinernema hermaphroditum]|uniref:Uncharacterized protein n=1 Tax=Steinernema hermaphroditum TaxID=289476 RepID=A0AA39HI29_9BILA|nr:hypothetical protein QR680_017794 [Steinernema hermaphroditum]
MDRNSICCWTTWKGCLGWTRHLHRRDTVRHFLHHPAMKFFAFFLAFFFAFFALTFAADPKKEALGPCVAGECPPGFECLEKLCYQKND